MQLDLANMSGRELRSLLDTARDRGQAQQSYEILQEMARRRMDEPRPKGRFGARRRPEPHLITLDLGDPLAPKDEAWDQPDPPEVADEAPLVLEREPPPARRERKAAPPPPPPPSLPRRRKAPVGVFVAGAVLGIGLGGVAGFVGALAASPQPPPLEIAAVEAAPLPVGALAPPPAAPVVAEPAPPPAPAVDPAAVTPAPEGLQLAVVSPDSADVDASALAAEPEAKPEPKAEPKPEPKVLKASAEPCTAATPADRAICRDPELQRLQKDLRQAYAEALEAHADRSVLRQRQLAWRDARNGVDDPERLAGLYSQRIRKLEAATAEARRLQR